MKQRDQRNFAKSCVNLKNDFAGLKTEIFLVMQRSYGVCNLISFLFPFSVQNFILFFFCVFIPPLFEFLIMAQLIRHLGTNLLRSKALLITAKYNINPVRIFSVSQFTIAIIDKATSLIT